MTAFFRNGLLSLACSILLAHSVIPHQHVESSVLSFSSHQTAEIQLFDLIRIVISEDLGNNHLQDFQPNSGFGSTLFHAITVDPLELDHLVVHTTRLTRYKGVYYPESTFIGEPDRTRGSPSLA